MPNRWVEHVKEFARKNNISYGCALSDPNLKKGYIPIGDKRRKPEKLEMAVPDTSVKPKGIVIKPHEVIPLQQAFPDTAVKAKNITIKPRPLAATLGDDFALLRALLLRPFGIGTAMLLQKGLVKAKKEWIDGSLSPNAVLTILELTRSQQTHLKSDGEEGRSGALIDVDKVEANRKEIDDLLAAITGQMGALELYHGGGMGSPHAFRMKLRGMGGIKQKREVLANVAKWLEKVPSVAAVRELYDKEFSGQRAEMARSEAAAKTDARVSGATAWLGHPLTEIDYKDVVRSLKALIKKHAFKYNGIQTLLKETDGNSAELISRVYKSLSGLVDRSRWDPILEDFKKSLLAKGFWVENVKRLPADLGAHIGSFLNLPKGVMKQLVARRTNKGKGYSGGAIRLPEDPLYLPPKKDRTLPRTLRNEDWIFIYDQAMGEPTQADYERVVEMADFYYNGDWSQFGRGLSRWIIDSYTTQEGELPEPGSEAGQELAQMIIVARREFNFLRNAALAAVARPTGAGVVARSSLVQGNPHAMWGGMMGGRQAPLPEAVGRELTHFLQNAPLTSGAIRRFGEFVDRNFRGNIEYLRSAYPRWLVGRFPAQETINQLIAALGEFIEALDEA